LIEIEGETSSSSCSQTVLESGSPQNNPQKNIFFALYKIFSVKKCMHLKAFI